MKTVNIWMRPPGRPWNHLVGIISVAVTVVLAVPLRAYWGNSTELLFVPAVVFSSLFCGRGPGLTSSVLSIAALIYFFEEPAFSFAIDSVRDVVDIVIFAFIAVLISGLDAAKQRAERILRGLLPICAWCKKVRREDKWVSLEIYTQTEMKTDLTHGICPDCRKRMEADLPTPSRAK